jgi:hypothetical protein
MSHRNYRLLWFIAYLVFTTGILIVLSASILNGPPISFAYEGPSQYYSGFIRDRYAMAQHQLQKEKAVTNTGVAVLCVGAALMVGHCFIGWRGGSSVPVSALKKRPLILSLRSNCLPGEGK